MAAKKKTTVSKKVPAKKKSTRGRNGAKQSRTSNSSGVQAKNSKTTEKKDSLIGIDPLAWLNEDSSDELDLANSVEENENPESASLEDCQIEEEKLEGAEELNTESTQHQEPISDEVEALDIGGSLTIREVSELYLRCKDNLQADKAIKINCSQVDKTDASGMQLLCMLNEHARTIGTDIEWLDPSDSIRRSAKLLGMSDELSL